MTLARNAAVLAGGKDPEWIGTMESDAKALLAEARQKAWTSPQIANEILRRVRNATGSPDPYREFKRREMASAKAIFTRIRTQLPRDLQGRIRMAVAGNSFDFFKDPETLQNEIVVSLEKPMPFAYDHMDRLEAFLKSGRQRILYLTDNAGEIYFDIPLYAHLKDTAGPPILMVKGGPALNDLTRTDLKEAGLEAYFHRIEDTGTDGAGIDWERVSDRFREHVMGADLILSKGMANFETVYPKGLPCPAFFLFRIKCEPIGRYITAPVGSSIALWKDPIAI